MIDPKTLSEEFERQKKYSCAHIEFVPNPEMTLNELEQYVRGTIFADMQGYENIEVVALLDGYDFKATLHTNSPETYHSTLRFWAAMNGWMRRGSINEDLLDAFKDDDNAKAIRDASKKALEQKCGDLEAMAEAFGQVEEAYIEFLVDIAEDVFESGFYHQLLWISEVNDFEDHINNEGTPLSKLGVVKLQGLINGSEDRRKAELAELKTVDMQSYRALQEVNETLHTCAKAFLMGDADGPYAGIRAIHPGALGPRIEYLKSRHNLKLSRP